MSKIIKYISVKSHFHICLFIPFLFLSIIALKNIQLIKALKIEMTFFEMGYVIILYGKWVFIFYIAALCWYFFLYKRYHPFKDVRDDQLPSVTVIVPAFNEGSHVFKTIESLVKSDYPKDLFDIIAVDDGSCDDTWLWMKRAEKCFSNNIKILKLKTNQGKREALACGFEKSTGRIVVTVDSDSVVEEKTLRTLVSPFLYDNRVGGVAGNVRVLNVKGGIIPKMMNVIFTFNFDFIRAGQSSLGSVMCTPGALAAYEMHLIEKNLSVWKNQMFLGRSSHIGEDRALTNLILKSGYHVVFQTNATVFTTIPTDLPTLWKMLLRWARSDIRETLFMTGFIFSKFRNGALSGTRINFVHHVMTMVQNQILILISTLLLIWYPYHLLVSIWIGSMITSSVAALFYLFRHRSIDGIWAYIYGLFWFFILSWILPYASITPQQSAWLTRQKR